MSKNIKDIEQAVFDAICEAKESIKFDTREYAKKLISTRIDEEMDRRDKSQRDAIELVVKNAVAEAMKDEVKPLKTIVYNVATEIKFVKWLGYTFASVVAFVGWDKFASTIRSLLS